MPFRNTNTNNNIGHNNENENENENKNENEKKKIDVVKELNNHFDEVTDKSKSFEDEIKLLKTVES